MSYLCQNPAEEMNDKVKYWVELSDYDLETARAMQVSRRYLYVGFMCHQCIEKILKAFYSQQFSSPPPFSHSLSYLGRKAGLTALFSEEQKEVMDVLEPLNIEARYPSQKHNLMKYLNKERCHQILSETQQLQRWIKQQL